MLVSVRLAEGCRANLRTRRLYAVVYRSFCFGRDRFGFRIVHYAVGRRSLRLICEATHDRALARGIPGSDGLVARRPHALPAK